MKQSDYYYRLAKTVAAIGAPIGFFAIMARQEAIVGLIVLIVIGLVIAGYVNSVWDR
jgi:hypothetical protein